MSIWAAITLSRCLTVSLAAANCEYSVRGSRMHSYSAALSTTTLTASPSAHGVMNEGGTGACDAVADGVACGRVPATDGAPRGVSHAVVPPACDCASPSTCRGVSANEDATLGRRLPSAATGPAGAVLMDSCASAPLVCAPAGARGDAAVGYPGRGLRGVPAGSSDRVDADARRGDDARGDRALGDRGRGDLPLLRRFDRALRVCAGSGARGACTCRHASRNATRCRSDSTSRPSASLEGRVGATGTVVTRSATPDVPCDDASLTASLMLPRLRRRFTIAVLPPCGASSVPPSAGLRGVPSIAAAASHRAPACAAYPASPPPHGPHESHRAAQRVRGRPGWPCTDAVGRVR